MYEPKDLPMLVKARGYIKEMEKSEGNSLALEILDETIRNLKEEENNDEG